MSKEKNLQRLKRIEGQVRGIHRMIEEDRYCPEVLGQIASVQQALRGLAKQVLQGHLDHCVAAALAAGDPARAAAMQKELLALLYKYSA
jgi:DNA-binding FrmR family transcriptional regulator